MRGGLAVRVDDRTRLGGQRNVTRHVKDLRFTKTAPGGHESASMRLTLPRDTFPDLGPADKVLISDTCNGRPIWEGYTENPGSTDGTSGQEFDLSAMGGKILASDQTRQLIYVDYSNDGWERAEDFASAASATTDTSTRPTDAVAALLCQFNPGQPITTNSRARLWYKSLDNADQGIGGLGVVSAFGITDANYELQIGVRDAAGVLLGTPVSRAANTAAAVHTIIAPTNFPHGGAYLTVQLVRAAGGATNVANDDTWVALTSLRVAGARVDRNGANVTISAPSSVKAHEVAEDLLGRMLAAVCDTAAARIDTTTYDITHLAYKDGVTAAGVLDDLALYEPDFLWEILHSTANGHIFNYRAWPTTPRYEISTRDGFNAPGGDVDLCNRIAVNYTDNKGKPQTVTVTQTVPELGARTRDAEPIDLPGVSTSGDATRIGQQVLAAKIDPPKAARATVARPILDHLTGSTVMPWEIEPGYVVRVRETGDDLRLTEMEYVDSDGAAHLQLGEPTLTTEQRIARLASRRK